MARATAKTTESASGQDGRRGRGLAQVRKMSAASHLDPALEARRRLATLLVTVPSLLNRHLRPVLGWHRFAFIPKVFALAGTWSGLPGTPDRALGVTLPVTPRSQLVLVSRAVAVALFRGKDLDLADHSGLVVAGNQAREVEIA